MVKYGIIKQKGEICLRGRKYKRYILYFIVILVLLMIGGKLTAGYYNELTESNNISFIKQSLINLLAYGGVGVVLGIDNLIREKRKEGKWKFDFKKLLIVGLPALVLSTPVFWATIIIICLKGKVDGNIMTIYNFMIIFNIILGHVFVTSIYREEERKVLEFRNLIRIN